MNIKKLTDKELIKVCKDIGSKIKSLKSEFAYLLIEVAYRGIYRRFGFQSILHFAKVVGGLSEIYATEVLRVGNRVKHYPLLREAIRTAGIGKVRVVLSVVNMENQALWADRVHEMSRDALVECVRAEGKSDSEIINSDFENVFFDLHFHVDKNTEFEFRKFKKNLEKKFKKALTMGEAFKILLKDKFQTEVPVEKQTLEVNEKAVKHNSLEHIANASRHIPLSQKRIVLQSTSGRCSFRGCN